MRRAQSQPLAVGDSGSFNKDAKDTSTLRLARALASIDPPGARTTRVDSLTRSVSQSVRQQCIRGSCFHFSNSSLLTHSRVSSRNNKALRRAVRTPPWNDEFASIESEATDTVTAKSNLALPSVVGRRRLRCRNERSRITRGVCAFGKPSSNLLQATQYQRNRDRSRFAPFPDELRWLLRLWWWWWSWWWWIVAANVNLTPSRRSAHMLLGGLLQRQRALLQIRKSHTSRYVDVQISDVGTGKC